MNTFANAARTPASKTAPKTKKVRVAKAPVTAKTANGAVTLASTMDRVLDLFSTVGALRGKTSEALNLFKAAFAEDVDSAIRVALWARDAREGAGERQTFRDILSFLDQNHPEIVYGSNLVPLVSELGRWDDLLSIQNEEIFGAVAQYIKIAIEGGNGLAAKWMPRKGPDAERLRKAWKFTPKQYRKFLVNNTSVVETQMCAQNWAAIELSKVPSVAAHRYKKAFERHIGTKFEKFAKAAAAGEVKVNSSVIYPYQLIRDLEREQGASYDLAVGQWEQMPNSISGDVRILAMSDVSGSMEQKIAGETSAMDISISIGLYTATKQTGPFRDLVLNFSEKAELIDLSKEKSLKDKARKIRLMAWGMSTNLQAAFENVLNHAIKHEVPESDMPTHILVVSDMEFNPCTNAAGRSASNMNVTAEKFEKAGYKLPKVVFWNVNARAGNAPVSFARKDAALVSGFSPSIFKSILTDLGTKYNPYNVMMETIGKDRYQWKF